MERLLVEVDAVAELHDLAEVHDRDAVTDVAHDGEVVGDEEVRQLELVLQVFEEVDDLRLDGHVQRGDRLVGDDELRLHREGARHADALALASGELVRVTVREVRVEADDLQQLLHTLGLGLALREVMDLDRLADDVADGHARVQRCVGVLEDHLHTAAHLPHLFAGERRQLGPIELHRAGRRLAAAGLADEAERLALLDEEVDAVNGAHRTDLPLEDDPLRQREVHLERAHLEEVATASRDRGAALALDELLLRVGRRHAHLVNS